MRFFKLFWRSCRLRCPMCGRGKLFRGWFSMNTTCPNCHRDLTREDGFYLGSIYLNYGVTTLTLAIVYPILLFTGTVSNDVLLWSSLGFVVVCPLLFFPFARSLWLGFDQLWDPKPGERGTGRS